MMRHTWMFSLVLAGCAQTSTGPLLPSDAGLPADIQTLAVAPLRATALPTVEDVAGVAFVPTTAASTWAAIAMPMDTPALTQTLWVRQVTRALPDLSVDGVTITVEDTAGLVVWTLNGTQDTRAAAVPTLLNAIATPLLTDDGLAGALSTRPHSSDPADPVTLRALHEQTAVKQRLWLSTDSAGRQRIESGTQAWPEGVPLADGDEWLSARARGYTALAYCQTNNVGEASPDTVRSVAKGIVAQRTARTTAVPVAAEAWRAAQPDFIGTLEQRIDQTDLPDTATASDCAFR